MARPTEAFVSGDLFELGAGTVVFTRFHGGKAESGIFLLDVYCLGVRRAYSATVFERDYEGEVLERYLPAEDRNPIDPPSARKLVEGAVAYARRLGFAPHADYKKAARFFGGTNAADSQATFTFGKGGKPLYVQGRFDGLATRIRILKQLRACCGDDGFDFMGFGEEAEIRLLESMGFKVRQQEPLPPNEAP